MSTVTVTGVDENGNTASATLTISGGGAQVPASPAWFGNSVAGKSGQSSLPSGVTVFSAIAGGGVLFGQTWSENTADGGMISAAGVSSGPRLSTRNGSGPPANLNITGGIWGICSDGTYVFYISRNGFLIASRLSAWASEFASNTWDNGQTVLTPAQVTSTQPMDMACAGSPTFLYFLDSAGSVSTVSPTSTVVKKCGPFNGTSWGTVSTVCSVPYGRRMCFDREGNLWVLTQVVSGNPSGSNSLLRFSPSGALLQSHAVPATVGYAMHVSCDTSQDRLYVTDNGTDQNIKVLSYDNANTAAPVVLTTIGVKGGYLDTTQGVKGQLGPLRFCGIRSTAMDAAGNLYVAQTGDPNMGQANWGGNAYGALISKLTPGFTTEAWRLHCGCSTGQPSSDWSKAYNFNWRYSNVNGVYNLPDACTIDYTADWIGRLGQSAGEIFTIRDDINPGTRYMVAINGIGGSQMDIYQEVGDIMVPRVQFKVGSSHIITNNVTAASPHLSTTDAWMDDAGNVWMTGVTGGNAIYRFRIQGFAADGTPQYNSANVDTFPLPSQINSLMHTIVVHGNNVYAAGFTTADNPNLASNPGGQSQPFDYYKQLGRVICKWTSLPTSSGWAAPAWQQTLTYPSGSAWVEGAYGAGGGLNYPNSFDVDLVNGVIVIGWFADNNNANNGWLTILRESDGTQVAHADPPYPGLGQTGSFDEIPRAMSCKNGWVWSEEDWQIKTAGMSLAPYKGL